MALLEVVIVTHNRSAYLAECLKTIVSQETTFKHKIIVSDNSSNDETTDVLSRDWPEIETRRFHAIPAAEHFNKTIELANAEYIMIYHDDDLLMPGCLQEMVNQLGKKPWLSAVCCNANLLLDDGSLKPMMNERRQHISITKPNELIQRYLDPLRGGAPPLSAYIYRTKLLKSSFFDASKGGKYSDVFFLLSVLSQGPFLWICKPYAYYRVHAGSDNAQFSFREKLSLIRSLHRDYGLRKASYMYRNAKSLWYRQFFGAHPSFRGLLILHPHTRHSLAQAFISRMVIIRLLRSHRYRIQLAKSLLNRLRAAAMPGIKSCSVYSHTD